MIPRIQNRLRPALLGGVFWCVATAVAAQTVSLSAPGASSDLVERLEANALLLRDPEAGETRSGQDIIAAARADYGRLIGILYEASYFAPVIRITLDGREASQISPFNAPQSVQQVEITVDTGPAFRLGRAEIGPLAPNTILPETFATGEPATTVVLRNATSAALDAWRDEGRATAAIASQQITARNSEAELDASIRIAPGPVVRFGQLLPDGQERMRRDRILEIAGLPVGEIYNPATLDRAAERLRETGAFSAVQLNETDLRSGDVMDITATLSEAPLRRLGAGFEISTDEGVGLSAYWLHRNLFGGAERLRFDASISGIDGIDAAPDIEVSARFDRPATISPDTLFTFEVLAFDVTEPLYDQTAFEVSARLSDRWSDTLSGSAGIALGFSRIDDALGRRDITLVSTPLGVTYDNRNDILDASSGAYADLELTPFLPLGGSGGARISFDGRGYLGFGDGDSTRAAARLQLGTVTGADITDLPSDFLFYSGGSGTVRGHEFQSLGARQNGVPSGGRSFLGLSGELRHDIGDTNFGIVGFADFGLITADEFGGGASDWHAGAGLGVRYATPFGPIRVDLATPIDDAGAGEDIVLYIGIGQSF